MEGQGPPSFNSVRPVEGNSQQYLQNPNPKNNWFGSQIPHAKTRELTPAGALEGQALQVQPAAAITHKIPADPPVNAVNYGYAGADSDKIPSFSDVAPREASQPGLGTAPAPATAFDPYSSPADLAGMSINGRHFRQLFGASYIPDY